VKFCEVFHATGDHARAAKAAGSRAKDLHAAGYVILRSLKVKRYLESMAEESRELAVQSTAAIRHEVHGIIDEALKHARRGAPVIGKSGAAIKGDDGKLVMRPDVTGMLKAAELKGKTVAMFRDVQQIESEMAGKSDDELFLVFEAGLTTNAMLLEKVARLDAVREKVHEHDLTDARGGEGDAGDPAQEAEPVSAAPKAVGVSPGRVH
jgi:hypothetical protein